MIIKTPKQKIIFTLVNVAVTFFVISQSISHIDLKENIWIEAEGAINDLKGFSVVHSSEASGNKAIVSEALSHDIGNYGEYEFFINSPGTYYTWARFFGENSCGNSFYISIDNSSRYLVGNDDLLRQWHWLRGPEIILAPGKHKLYILNEENKTKIDRLLITTNSVFVPSGLGESNDFNINFNNNFSNIIVFNDSTKWGIENINSLKAIHSNSSGKDLNYFIIKEKLPLLYCFKSEFYYNVNKDFSLVLVLNYLDDKNYRFLELMDGVVSLFEMANNNLKQISTSNLNIRQLLVKDEINNLSLIQEDTFQYVFLNSNKILEIKKHDLIGNIGMGSRTSSVYYTNLSLNSNLKPAVNITFFNGLFGNWKIINGEWKLYKEPLFLFSGSQNSNDPAIITYGEEYWKNYSVSAAVHYNSVNNTTGGLIFNLQNKSNYYLFKCEGTSTGGNIKLIKVKDGKQTVLCSGNKKIDNKQIYLLEIKVFNGKISAYIDNNLIISYTDTEFNDGKIGLYSNGMNNEIWFDDLIVQPTIYEADSIFTRDYIFYNRFGISKELSDWENSFDFLSKERDRVFKTKKLFESQTIFNKNIFTDEIDLISTVVFIPSDIDMGILLSSIESNNKIEVILKHNKLIVKINNGFEAIDIKDITKKELRVFYKDSAKKLIVKINNIPIYEKQINTSLNKYKFGLEFLGIGSWDIFLPHITLKANKVNSNIK